MTPFWALGMGHWGWGIGHWALGIGHWYSPLSPCSLLPTLPDAIHRVSTLLPPCSPIPFNYASRDASRM
ncbi:hypothetical protein B4U84_15840 [Westiellopsis prolifica IICB1]|nr:hypothetical protein B4U84_15840 [Westiellopsis prolifica IICB1]